MSVWERTSVADKKARATHPRRGALNDLQVLWHRFQKDEDWLAPGHVLIADPQARNRRINAAYAQLWLADNRFQWAGVALKTLRLSS